MIEEIAFVAYAVADVPRAVTFYRDVLGLKIGKTFNDGFVEFEIGSSTFAIDGDSPGYEPGTSTGLNFEVSDIAAYRARLAGSGVEISRVHEFPTCSVCFAKDPEGNRFALHQRKGSEPQIEHAFAGIPVADYPRAIAWYSNLLDRPPDAIVREGVEAMWRLTSSAWVYVVLDPERAGRALVTILLSNLDGFLASVAGRGVKPPDIETAPGLFRRAGFTDTDGNAIAFGERLDGPKVPKAE